MEHYKILKKSIEERALELLKDDKELHDAFVDWLKARTKAELELANWRKRRK